MFNALFALIKKEFALNTLTTICSNVDSIINSFDAAYLVDGNTKDAAIDTVIAILQQHKTNVK